MEQKDKELLLKDLSARLPYGVIVRHADPLIDNYGNETGKFWYKKGYLYSITALDGMTTTIIESEGSDEEGYEHICPLERTIPYLRPMSSMTEEESAELSNTISEWFDEELFYLTEEPFLEYALSELNYSISPQLFDWLNAHHFDHRGLIGKNLAIEITEENNPYKE